MSHPLDSIVDDMYSVTSHAKGVHLDPAILSRFATRVALHADETLFTGGTVTPSKRDPSIIRASDIGTPCLRQFWYKYFAPEAAEPITGKMGFKFLYGDLVEESVLLLAEAAGYAVGCRQMEVVFEPHGEKYTVVGHIDATIDGIVVDVKSASSFAFDEVSRNNWILNHNIDKFGYNYQLTFYYMMREQIPGASPHAPRFLYVNKQDGSMAAVAPAALTPAAVFSKIEALAEVLELNEIDVNSLPRLAPEAHNKSGNMKLGMTCSYCAFKAHCWKSVGIAGYAYANGPVYLVCEIKKEPDVPRFL